MKSFLSYWLWPNPAGWYYDDTKVVALIVVCGALVLLSFVLRFWRSQVSNLVTRSLTASWSSASFWSGVVGLLFVVSRVETIQFLSMRILWALWMLSIALYLFFQCTQFRRKHYVVIERAQIVDEREKYLPKKRNR